MAKKKKKNAVQAAQLAANQLFERLQQLTEEGDPGERSVQAWRTLRQAASSEDFQVGLDFALEHDLAPAESITPLRNGPHTRTMWENPRDGSQMVWIPPGPYVVGKKNQPAHNPQGFFLARHPVTNAQFARFVEATGYTNTEPSADFGELLKHWTKTGYPAKKANHPVVWVSYLDAIAYCRWAGLDLPTEWLWEKAARGEDGQPFPWGSGNSLDSTKRAARVSAKSTQEVGKNSQIRTPYGCEDLIGNVSEWCHPGETETTAEYGKFPPPAWIAQQQKTPGEAAVRGSCFLRTGLSRMVAAHRRRLSARRRNQWVGFRPAFYPAAGMEPAE